MPPPQWITQLRPLPAPPPLRTLVRSTADKLNPPKVSAFEPSMVRRQRALLAAARARVDQVNPIFREERPGQIPTIVVGGFVPGPQDATYLQRGIFLRYGSIYHLQFSQEGFDSALFEAQLSDLVEELAVHHGTPPVIFAVSFGAGVVIRWLANLAQDGHSPDLAGVLLVSPVACTADVLERGAVKPSTLLGRMMKGFLETPLESEPRKVEAWVEKSRQVMVKMFESGAQNKEALKKVLSRGEVLRIRHNVIESMRLITARGAHERTRALDAMPPVDAYSRAFLPLSEAPALVLYAEKESSIMVEESPTRCAFEANLRRYFPEGRFHIVSNSDGSPVQHASLLFHCFNFEPYIIQFYKRLKRELPGTRKIQHTLTRFIRPAHVAHRRKAEAAARAAALASADGGLASA